MTQTAAPAPPALEYLADIDVEVLKPPQNVGATGAGKRVIFQVGAGSVRGPRLNGEVLPGAGDWVLVEPDGLTRLDVRMALKLDDGALVYLSYRGVIDPANGYFRSAPVFETGAEAHRWLTRVLCVGVGRRTERGVAYSLFVVR